MAVMQSRTAGDPVNLTVPYWWLRRDRLSSLRVRNIMRMRLALPVLACLLPALTLLTGSAPARATDRPNILFIFTDDHAAHAMSCYGSKINRTPGLDRIASEGLLFRNCFCTNSICGPSRAVILTGKHSHLNGFLHNGQKFNATQQVFPQLLQQAGYQTAIVGKWHLGHGGQSDPSGFNYWEVLQDQGPYFNPVMLKAGGPVRHTGYTTEILTDLALDWLKTGRDPEKPFMLMFQHKAPHREWQPGPKYYSLYKDVQIPEPATLFDDWSGRGRAAHEQDMTVEKTLTPLDLKLVPPRNLTEQQLAEWHAAYDAENEAFRTAGLTGKDLVRWKYQRYIKDYLRCVAAVDDSVSQVLDYLDATGLSKNTLVVYSSDQGFFLGDHGWFDKRFMYEESYRMPLLMRWPGRIQPGTVSEALVSNLDYAETFLAAAGVDIPKDMQGASLLPLLDGSVPPDWRKSLYYHYYEFFSDQKAPHMVRRHYGVRTARHKLIHFYNVDEWELFDLQRDPDELKSVYSDPAYAGVVRELTAEVQRLQQHYQVPDDRGSVPKDPPSLRPDFQPKPAGNGAKAKKKIAA